MLLENRVPRRIFGSKMDEITEEWRELHNEKLNDLYRSPSIVRVIKSRRMRWTGHVVHMGDRRVAYGIWWENLRERGHLEDAGVEGMIILRGIFRKWDVGHGLYQSVE
jgi:hypothetical protein